MSSEDQIIRDRLAQLAQDVDRPEAVVAEIERRFVRNTSRRRILRSALVAAAVLVGASGVGVALSRSHDDTVATGPTGPGLATLALPSPGEVAGTELADGSPVWLVRHMDGTIDVLDAVSGHRPYGVGQLVGWCAASRTFEDPQGGSVYDEFGEARGGPAPTGLRSYPIAQPDGTTLVVVGSAVELPRILGRPRDLDAPSCSGLDSTSLHAGYSPGMLRLHPITSRAAGNLGDAMMAPEGALVVVSNAVVVLEGNQAVACPSVAAPIDAAPACDEGVPVLGTATSSGDVTVTISGDFLAWVSQGRLEGVAYLVGYTIEL